MENLYVACKMQNIVSTIVAVKVAGVAKVENTDDVMYQITVTIRCEIDSCC